MGPFTKNLPLKRLAVGALALGAASQVGAGVDKAKEYNAEFQPKYAEPKMSTTHLMQKVAEVSPQTYDFLLKTAEEVKASPFRDEILTELDSLMTKAAKIDWGKGVPKAGLGIGAAAATGVAMALAGDAYDAVKRGITKGRNYRSMLRENPDLGEMQGNHVQKAFATLHRFNPEFAGDPMVAGSFVRRQAALGEFDAKQLTDLVGARKNLKDVKTLPSAGKLPWNDKPESDDGKHWGSLFNQHGGGGELP